MNKIIAAGCMAVATFAAVAVPSGVELEKARSLVENTTKSELAAYKAGEKTAQQVAVAHIAYAQKAESEAEKYLLYQGAFKLYVRCGEYDLAADTLQVLNREIKDIPSKVIAEIVGDELRYVADGKATRLNEMLNEAKAKSADVNNQARYLQNLRHGAARRRTYVGEASSPPQMKEVLQVHQATVDGYTWSYRVYNGEATIEAMKDGKYVCAVSPVPTGDVAIPSTLNGVKVTSIGREAFVNCKELTSVTIPEGVACVGVNAFWGCGGLKSAKIPPSVRNFEQKAFEWCGKLADVMIPEGVTNIGVQAFYCCGAHKSVVIPSSVTRIGSWAFAWCADLTDIVVDDENAFYSAEGGVLYDKKKTELICCPSGKSGTAIIPSGVARIRSWAFAGCKRSALTIPPSVTSIESCSFFNCRQLNSVIMCGERPTAPADIFNKCSNLKEIHVPANAKSWAGMKTWQGIPLIFDANLQVAKDRTTVQSIIDGMIKVPGRDFWLSETELTQGQWEAVMGYNLSTNKGDNLPAGCVSRDDCDVFLEKLNLMEDVRSSQFEFALPTSDEWAYAARAGGYERNWWIRPGVVGDFLQMAWLKENSGGQTHVVATKAPNAFGFYDMKGNVWEWMSNRDNKGRGHRMGGSCGDTVDEAHRGWNTPSGRRYESCGLRVAAHVRPRSLLGGLRRPGSARGGLLRKANASSSAVVQTESSTEKARREQRQQLADILDEQKRVRMEKVKAARSLETKAQSSLVVQAESSTEKTRKAVAQLFPGWSLDTEVAHHDFAGLQSSHRGQNNVVFVHPKCEGASAILSRTLTLSNQNPCLFLKVASWDEETDFLLSVRVNGTVALPRRRICTPDYAPWEDVTVPLSAWRGKVVKVEIVLTANGWWYEFPFLSRIEIAEGTGDMRMEGKATVDGYTWSYRVNNGEAMIVADNPCAITPKPKGALVIPSTLDGYKVTSIGWMAFRDCKELTSVTIPEGVTSIKWCAFYDCYALAEVKIPATMKGIERAAFAHCGSLTSVTIPNGVTDIGIHAFVNCSGLASVMIPSGVKVLKQEVFRICRKLESATIPEGVESIKSGCFSWLCGIKSAEIPSSVTNIEEGAFVDCGELRSFHVDSGNPCYSSRNKLLCSKDGTVVVAGVNGDVVIPDGVKSIGADAFRGCVGLATVTIPSSVTNIGLWAFAACTGLKSVNVDEGNAFFKSVNGSLLTKDGRLLVRGIGCDGAIPAGVTNIGDCAFSGGELISVTIPESVTNIEGNAFVCCGRLTSVTMRGERPEAPNNVFKGCRNLKAIHVPAKAKSWAGMKEWQGIPLVFDAK